MLWSATARSCARTKLREVGQTSASNGIRERQEVSGTEASWLDRPTTSKPGRQGWQERREAAFSMSSGSPVPGDTKTASSMVLTIKDMGIRSAISQATFVSAVCANVDVPKIATT